MTGIWGTILDIGLRLIGWILDKTVADEKVQKQFLSFLEALEEKQMVSSKLTKSYKEQLEELKKEQTK